MVLGACWVAGVRKTPQVTITVCSPGGPTGLSRVHPLSWDLSPIRANTTWAATPPVSSGSVLLLSFLGLATTGSGVCGDRFHSGVLPDHALSHLTVQAGGPRGEAVCARSCSRRVGQASRVAGQELRSGRARRGARVKGRTGAGALTGWKDTEGDALQPGAPGQGPMLREEC